LLGLVLVDNFTYTLFGVGIAHANDLFRVVYTMLLSLLTLLAGRALYRSFVPLDGRRGFAVCGVVVALCLAIAPTVVAARRLPRDPDATVLAALASDGRSTNRPNILFLGADGLDATFLSVYGYERPTTPFLDEIRDDTLFFENAFSNVARTHGSLVTLLTGRLPFSTGVTFPPTVLQGEDSYRTLPLLLKDLGYATLQLGMRHYADAEDTNVRGFDAANYRWQRLEELEPGAPVADDTDVFRRAVAERIDERLGQLFGVQPAVDAFAHVEGRQVVPQWRDDRRVTTLVQYFEQAPEPWFVHLHLLDTHCCQWAPDVQHFNGGASPVIDARDSQIRETDAHIRRLFEALASTGRLERTIVVINSDHASNWKITERIPLMIRFPGRAHAGRVHANVQIADVAPTMLRYLGVDVPEWMDGLPLVPSSALPDHRPIFGVADVTSTAGPNGTRQLRDSGSRNHGIKSVMMVDGHRWYAVTLETSAVASGDVQGHTVSVSEPTAASEADARRHLLSRVASMGLDLGPSADVTLEARHGD
jgi:arylsulfatase A-like enzyme